MYFMEKNEAQVGGSSCFVDWVEQRGLIDLGFIGPTFTWNHGNSVETWASAKLDMGLCDIW